MENNSNLRAWTPDMIPSSHIKIMCVRTYYNHILYNNDGYYTEYVGNLPINVSNANKFEMPRMQRGLSCLGCVNWCSASWFAILGLISAFFCIGSYYNYSDNLTYFAILLGSTVILESLFVVCCVCSCRIDRDVNSRMMRQAKIAVCRLAERKNLTPPLSLKIKGMYILPISKEQLRPQPAITNYNNDNNSQNKEPIPMPIQTTQGFAGSPP